MVIGLHSQSLNNSDGFVSGSEITTGYLMKAFLSKAEVDYVFRFSPGNYNLDSSLGIDLVLIEGWHPEVPYFVSLIRKVHPKAKIIFWNLSFYGFIGVLRLDVDGYLSNSKKNTVILNKIKPTKYVMLAADLIDIQNNEFQINRTKDVVYLGLNHTQKSEALEKLILHEAKSFDFSIYGTGWGNHVSLSPYWKGILPVNEIHALYSSSNVVLGMTEDRQRRSGMINNRVFEALSCGACFISEYFSELENVFGDLIFYSREKGDTKSTIEKILQDSERMINHRKKTVSFIKENHTYNHRVDDILSFYYSFL